MATYVLIHGACHDGSAFDRVVERLHQQGHTALVTKSLAIEYARNRIRVNAVSPGVVDTPMHAEDNHAALAAMHPRGRLATVADIVRVVLYLEAAPFVTGEFLHIVGGLSAGR